MESKGTIIEIERKWLLKKVPLFALSYEKWYLSYAYTESNDRYQEAITPRENKYAIVHKTGDGLARKEATTPITEEDFIEKATDDNTRKIQKVRYMVPHMGGLIEIDDYKNLRLVIMEYEIKVGVGNKRLDEIAEKFRTKDLKLPKEVEECIITEVTGQKEFANQYLAIK